MTIRRATDADIPRILSLLALTPNPPNIEAEEIADLIREDIIVAESTGQAAVRLHKRNGADVIDVPWWVWDGINKLAHVDVMVRGINDLILRFPASGLWPIEGRLDGTGDTQAERKAGSRTALDDISTGLTAITKEEADNSNHWVGRSTVGDVETWIKAVVVP